MTTEVNKTNIYGLKLRIIPQLHLNGIDLKFSNLHCILSISILDLLIIYH